MNTIEREVGKLEARMETVETELQAIRADVREIRDALVGARAGWFLLTAAIAISSAMGAAVSRFLPFTN
jgi:chromosome condensin MukBEF ATPase and DNA-binding subunit MukB